MDSITLSPYLNLETLSSLEKQQKQWEQNPQKMLFFVGEDEKCFCHGLDFRAMLELDEQTFSEAISRFISFLCFLKETPAISVAIVSGSAIGGGVGLAAACDFVLATENSSFQLSEGLFGFVPGVIFPLLSQRVSLPKLRRMILTASVLSAMEAYQEGLVDQVFTPKKGKAYWKKVLNRFHPESILQWKALEARYHTPLDWKKEMVYGGERLKEQFKKLDITTGLQKYLENGEPPWLKGTFV